MEWQPIETAPMDGRRILTFREGFQENIAVAWYSASTDMWIPVYGDIWPNPTHWMPLPQPPKESA